MKREKEIVFSDPDPDAHAAAAFAKTAGDLVKRGVRNLEWLIQQADWRKARPA